MLVVQLSGPLCTLHSLERLSPLSSGRDEPSRVWGSPGIVALQLFSMTCSCLLSPQALLSRGKELLHKAMKNQVSSLGWALLGLGVLIVLLSRAEPVPAFLQSPCPADRAQPGAGKGTKQLLVAECCVVLLVTAIYGARSSSVVPLRPVPAICVLDTRELLTQGLLLDEFLSQEELKQCSWGKKLPCSPFPEVTSGQINLSAHLGAHAVAGIKHLPEMLLLIWGR